MSGDERPGMILKHIICSVPEEHRRAFALGQERWRALATLPGFLLQFGGFLSHRAHIFGLWADNESYASFMSFHHDRVAEAAAQAGTYTSIEVTLFEARGVVPLHRLPHNAWTAELELVQMDRDRGAESGVWINWPAEIELRPEPPGVGVGHGIDAPDRGSTLSSRTRIRLVPQWIVACES